MKSFVLIRFYSNNSTKIVMRCRCIQLFYDIFFIRMLIFGKILFRCNENSQCTADVDIYKFCLTQ